MTQLLHKPASTEPPLLLFSDFSPRAACVFCGDGKEGRYMCSTCRRVPLVQMFGNYIHEYRGGSECQQC